VIRASLIALAALTASAAADRNVALKYFRAGEKAYQAQNFEAAAQNFDSAFKELELPELAFSAAQAYRRAHRVKSNAGYVQRSVLLYRFYLSKVTEGGRVGDAADSLGEMERELEKLGVGTKAPPPPVEEKTALAVTATLVGVDTLGGMREIEDLRAGAEPEILVTTKIDGQVVTPAKMVEVTEGDHIVRAEAPGFAPFEKREVAVKGHRELVELTLQPLPALVTITTERGARISIDGRGIGTAPLAAIEVPAGKHVLTVIHRGREPVARDLTVTRGQRVALDIDLESTLRRRSVTWVLVGAGVLAVTSVATGLGALYEDGVASDKLDQLQQGSQPSQVGREYADARDLRDSLITGTWVTGGAAVAVGLAAGFLYYFDNPSAEGLRVAPMSTQSGAGAALIGRF
jgi:hypothetical protein